MNSDTAYLVFAGISAIGAICVLRGKSLDKYERLGVWIIFGGFLLQTFWYAAISNWSALNVAALVVFLLLVPAAYFVGRKLKGK